MSSIIEIERLCLFCNSTFIAKTTKTKYCSLKYASKAYKEKQREFKINSNNKQTLSKPNSTDSSILKYREYFTVSKAALLLGINRATMFSILYIISAERIKGITSSTFICSDTSMEYGRISTLNSYFKGMVEDCL